MVNARKSDAPRRKEGTPGRLGNKEEDKDKNKIAETMRRVKSGEDISRIGYDL